LPTNIIYAVIFSPIRTTCPAHLILKTISIVKEKFKTDRK
jgi:hypothetical protein